MKVVVKVYIKAGVLKPGGVAVDFRVVSTHGPFRTEGAAHDFILTQVLKRDEEFHVADLIASKSDA